jgi:ADP-ribosylglycohydrolase
VICWGRFIKERAEKRVVTVNEREKKMILEEDKLQKKILGCWTGKNIGGTLGGPYEGIPGTHQLTFYDPVPTEPLPNDDLDLQVLFLEYLLKNYKGTFGPDVLRQAWVDHCEFPWDEYGICQRNSELGLSGADVGAVDNWFSDGMGAAIRTELWACLAPGDPDRATGFAWADAVCDHCSDGVWATIFIAAIESMAFVESDKLKLIECGLSFIPEDTRVSCAVRFAMQKWNELHELMPVRNALVEQFGTTNFTDVAANMGIIVLSWLAGEDDFGKSICHAVNCGLDTDCTCATLGSILGIINPDCIPDKWKAPVGEDVKLSAEIVGIEPPADLNELTKKTMKLSELLKDETPAVGEVKARQMGGYSISLTYEQVTDRIFGQQQVETGSLGNQAIVSGHWFDAAPLAGDAEAVLLNFSFELERDTDVRVMAYYRDRARVWVDGASYADYEPSLWFAGYHGPSFHRFQDQAPALSLSKGTHSLMVALKNKTPESHDVVIGIGDAAENLWISKALVS